MTRKKRKRQRRTKAKKRIRKLLLLPTPKPKEQHLPLLLPLLLWFVAVRVTDYRVGRELDRVRQRGEPVTLADAVKPIPVRGGKEQLKVYRVIAAKERVFRVRARGVEGVRTRLVGREAELDALKPPASQY